MQKIRDLTIHGYLKDIDDNKSLSFTIMDSSGNIYGYWTPRTTQWSANGKQGKTAYKLCDLLDVPSSLYENLISAYARTIGKTNKEAIDDICADAMTFIEDNIASNYQNGNVEVDMSNYTYTLYSSSAKPLTQRARANKPKVIKNSISIWI